MGKIKHTKGPYLRNTMFVSALLKRPHLVQAWQISFNERDEVNFSDTDGND